jgi:hypothetical protein
MMTESLLKHGCAYVRESDTFQGINIYKMELIQNSSQEVVIDCNL